MYPTGILDQEPTNLNATTTRMNVNGSPMGTTEFTMDGVPNTQTSNADFGVGMANSPPVDMVQEFKVETAFDASVGHTSGTIVNLVLKTGGNQPHGTLYIFDRQPDWAANTFFGNLMASRAATLPIGSGVRVSTDRSTSPKSITARIGPSSPSAMKACTRTRYSRAPHSPFPIRRTSAATSRTCSHWGRNIRCTTPYDSACRQRSILDPAVSRKHHPVEPDQPDRRTILNHYPAPNTTGNADGTNNYADQTTAEPLVYYNHMARMDHSISDKPAAVRPRFGRAAKIDGPYRAYWNDPSVGNN